MPFDLFKNDIEKKYKAARLPVNEAEEAIKSTMQCKTFREDALLKTINANRAILAFVRAARADGFRRRLRFPRSRRNDVPGRRCLRLP